MLMGKKYTTKITRASSLAGVNLNCSGLGKLPVIYSYGRIMVFCQKAVCGAPDERMQPHASAIGA
jgi:hypothetical protein